MRQSISLVLFRVSDFCSNSKNRRDSIGFCTNCHFATIFRVAVKIAFTIAIVRCERTLVRAIVSADVYVKTRVDCSNN